MIDKSCASCTEDRSRCDQTRCRGVGGGDFYLWQGEEDMTMDNGMDAPERMSFNEYQVKANTTASYTDPFYPFWGLMEEAAEVSKLVGKQWLRGDDKEPPTKEQVTAELGDVLWMLSEIAHQMEIPLQAVAEYNIAKLADRSKRGVIKGDGAASLDMTDSECAEYCKEDSD